MNEGLRRKGTFLPAYYESAKFAKPNGGPADLNYKPRVYSGGGRGGAGSGDGLPLRNNFSKGGAGASKDPAGGTLGMNRKDGQPIYSWDQLGWRIPLYFLTRPLEMVEVCWIMRNGER